MSLGMGVMYDVLIETPSKRSVRAEDKNSLGHGSISSHSSEPENKDLVQAKDVKGSKGRLFGILTKTKGAVTSTPPESVSYSRSAELEADESSVHRSITPAASLHSLRSMLTMSKSDASDVLCSTPTPETAPQAKFERLPTFMKKAMVEDKEIRPKADIRKHANYAHSLFRGSTAKSSTSSDERDAAQLKADTFKAKRLFTDKLSQDTNSNTSQSSISVKTSQTPQTPQTPSSKAFLTQSIGKLVMKNPGLEADLNFLGKAVREREDKLEAEKNAAEAHLHKKLWMAYTRMETLESRIEGKDDLIATMYSKTDKQEDIIHKQADSLKALETHSRKLELQAQQHQRDMKRELDKIAFLERQLKPEKRPQFSDRDDTSISMEDDEELNGNISFYRSYFEKQNALYRAYFDREPTMERLDDLSAVAEEHGTQIFRADILCAATAKLREKYIAELEEGESAEKPLRGSDFNAWLKVGLNGAITKANEDNDNKICAESIDEKNKDAMEFVEQFPNYEESMNEGSDFDSFNSDTRASSMSQTSASIFPHPSPHPPPGPLINNTILAHPGSPPPRNPNRPTYHSETPRPSPRPIPSHISYQNDSTSHPPEGFF